MPQKRYLTQRYPESEKVKETGRRRALTRTKAFMTKKGGSIQLREPGEPYGPRLTAREALRRVARRSRIRHTFKAIIRRLSDGEEFSLRTINKESFPVPDLGCLHAIEVAHGWIWDHFPGRVRSGGRFVCRYIDGTHTVSRHGFVDPRGTWKGAAEDVFIDGDMGDLVAMARAIVGAAEESVLDLDTVIVNRMIWTSGTGVWHEYNGAVHYHVHVDKLAGEPCRP
jgi:hypothetical protein